MKTRWTLAVLICVTCTAARASEYLVPLNCNWNGMVHPGETGQPDAADGFRSVSDRALYISNANANALGTNAIVGTSGIHYSVITAAGVLDIVHLGGTGTGTNRPWDAAANTNNIGVQPAWLTGLSAHLSSQTTPISPPITLDGNASIGILYNVSNGGGGFDLTLTFTDASTATVTLSANDWFGAINPPAAGAGVESQTRLGGTTYTATSNVDLPTIHTYPSNALAVTEAAVSASSLVQGGKPSIVGKQLASISFSNPTQEGNGYAIYAATVVYGLLPPANDDCAAAQVVAAGTTPTTSIRATGTQASPCGLLDLNDVWYRYDATTNGRVEARTCGAAFDTTLGVYADCGGALIACDDNACGVASRVAWNAAAGQSYLVRVAMNNAATGDFSLVIEAGAALHTDITLPLAYNWNGIVQIGETGQADAANGFRSVSDRALYLTGASGAANRGTLVNADLMPYALVNQPFVLDLVHIGRTGAGTFRTWDATTNTNNRGVQPAWLTALDQSGPQSTDLSALNLQFGADTKLGVLYNISNGGGSLLATLAFADATTATVTMQGPDWVGNLNPAAPGAGVETARRVGGLYNATQNTDAAALNGSALNLVESIVSTASLLASGHGDVAGRKLTTLTFAGVTANTNGIAIYSATLRDAVVATPVLPPTGIGAAIPAVVDAGRALLLTVQVSPGSNPASTGMSVVCDASTLGGSASLGLHDDGTNGDAAAGDGIYSHVLLVPVGQAVGVYALPFSVADAQSRSSAGALPVQVRPRTWSESLDGGGDAGALPASAQAMMGVGPLGGIRGTLADGDVDVFRVLICDPVNFTATTINGETRLDTQLFLFDATGRAVAMNDDDPAGSGVQSKLSNAFVSSMGVYYLAVTRFNADPRDGAGRLLWKDAPVNAERAGDGPGAADPVAKWDAPSGAGGAYVVHLSGACHE